MIRPLPGPRILLNGAEEAGFEVVGEGSTVIQFATAALAYDDAEQPFVLQLFNRIMLLPEGPERDYYLIPFLAREIRDRAQRKDDEEILRHARVLLSFARAVNGYVEQLRSLVYRFLSAGGAMEPPVQMAGYRRGGPKGPEAA
jgi:hypothetical protein